MCLPFHWGFVVVAVLPFSGAELVLLLNLCVECYYLLFCYSVCLPVFAVVG